MEKQKGKRLEQEAEPWRTQQAIRRDGSRTQQPLEPPVFRQEAAHGSGLF